jgi:hypothetical protein
MVKKLFTLIFNSDPNVRLAVYEFFGSVLEFLQATSLVDSILGILILALGDGNAAKYISFNTV